MVSLSGSRRAGGAEDGARSRLRARPRAAFCVSQALLLPPPPPLAVSLGRRVAAVQHGAGGHVAQQPVHPLRVLADLQHQLGSVHREERVRQLRPGDPGPVLAEGERRPELGRLVLIGFICTFLEELKGV